MAARDDHVTVGWLADQIRATSESLFDTDTPAVALQKLADRLDPPRRDTRPNH